MLHPQLLLNALSHHFVNNGSTSSPMPYSETTTLPVQVPRLAMRSSARNVSRTTASLRRAYGKMLVSVLFPLLCKWWLTELQSTSAPSVDTLTPQHALCVISRRAALLTGVYHSPLPRLLVMATLLLLLACRLARRQAPRQIRTELVWISTLERTGLGRAG